MQPYRSWWNSGNSYYLISRVFFPWNQNFYHETELTKFLLFQDKLVQEIFSHEDKDKYGYMSHEEKKQYTLELMESLFSWMGKLLARQSMKKKAFWKNLLYLVLAKKMNKDQQNFQPQNISNKNFLIMFLLDEHSWL